MPAFWHRWASCGSKAEALESSASRQEEEAENVFLLHLPSHLCHLPCSSSIYKCYTTEV